MHRPHHTHAHVPARPSGRPRRSEVERAVAAVSPHRPLGGDHERDREHADAATAEAEADAEAEASRTPSPPPSFVTLAAPAPAIPARPARSSYRGGGGSDNIHSFEDEEEQNDDGIDAAAGTAEEEMEEEEDDEGYYLAAGAKPIMRGGGGASTGGRSWAATAAAAAAAAANASSSAAGASAAASQQHVRNARRIRFRVVKLSKTGLYTERLMTLDPATNSLVFQPLETSRERALQVTAPVDASTGRVLKEGEKGFALGDLASLMLFDSALASPGSAASGSTGSGASFSARLMMVFHRELSQRPYELLFQDVAQRREFVEVVHEMYGIEVIAADESIILGSSSSAAHSTTVGAAVALTSPSVNAVKWVPDSSCHACMKCGATFSLMFRKHHCRSCGGIFCGPCSDQNASLPELGHSKPQRVCRNCFEMICEVRKAGLMVSAVGAAINVPSSAAAGPAGQGYNGMDDSLVAKNSAGSKTAATAAITAETTAAHRPQFLRTTSSAAAAGSQFSFSSSPVSRVGSPNRSSVPRDIYGFLLSSPTLALVAASNTQRDHTVLHMSSAPSTAGGGAAQDADSYSIHAAAHDSDAGNSTLPPQSPSMKGMSAADAAAASAFQASLLAAQQARLALQQVEIDAARARWNKYFVLHTTIDRNSTELRRLVRRGIPPELRGQLWQVLSGSRDKQAALQAAHSRRYHAQLAQQAARGLPTNPLPSRDNITEANYYSHVLACSQNPANLSVSVAEIDKDCHRTFPDNQWFEDLRRSAGAASPRGGAAGATGAAAASIPAPAAGLAMLRRVLLAYSFHNPAIGYAQSMNFLSALLLLFMDEEDAFFMLVVLLEDICAIETEPELTNERGDVIRERKVLYYHSPDLAGAHIDQKVYADLVAEKLPKVAAQFERLAFPLAPLTMSWLLCLFVNTLPLDTTLVLWDCVFSEGVKILMRASLTLLKVHEKQILRCTDFEELLIILKTMSAFHPTLAEGPSASEVAAVSAAVGVDQAPSGPQLIPPSIDTAGFLRICFDPLFIGSFPLTKITALRNFHRLQVEEELATRKSKVAQAKKRMDREQRERLANAAASAGASGRIPGTGLGRAASLQQQSQAQQLPPPDPSVEFLLTAAAPPDSSGKVISQYYTSPPPAVKASSDDSAYVPIDAPAASGGSPRIGKSLHILEAEGAEETSTPKQAAATKEPAATEATSPPAATRPIRPATSDVKTALNRVSSLNSAAEPVSASSAAAAGASPQRSLSRQISGGAAASSSTAATSASPGSHSRPRKLSAASISPSSSSPKVSAASPAKSGGSSPPGVLSSMLSSVGRALSQVLTDLTDDERRIEQQRMAEHKTAASPTLTPQTRQRTRSGSSEQRGNINAAAVGTTRPPLPAQSSPLLASQQQRRPSGSAAPPSAPTGAKARG